TSLNGGAGDDTFIFEDGARVFGRIEGGQGSDTLDYSAYTTQVIVNMEGATPTATGTGKIGAIENVFGGSGDDVFTGDRADNLFRVNRGNDTIAAREGNDIVVGGDGDDVILDTTVANPNVPEFNVLIGGRGADTITGLGGKEELMIGD